MAEASTGWQFWIDRGGTFTDVVGARAGRRAADPQAAVAITPSSTTTPRSRACAICSGSRRERADPGRADRCGQDGHDGRHQRAAGAQGRADRAGDHRGFADALRIGYQNRPDIFARSIVLPELLYERVVEIDERVTRRRRGADDRSISSAPGSISRPRSPAASARSRSS